MNQSSNQSDIITHNDSIGDDYRFWSPSFNIHFGYWKWGVNPFNREAMLIQMNKEILKRLRFPADSKCLIVDAGCGTGATLRDLANCLPYSRFVGVTLATWLLEKGIRLNKQSGVSKRIELIRADFQKMPIADGCVDAVICLESVCYAEGQDKKKLVHEIHRILKPGGRFIIVDAFRKRSKRMPAFLEKLYRKNAKLWAVEELAVLPNFKKTLSNAGFGKIKIEDISLRTAPTAMHIPFVVLRLWWNGNWRRNNYWKALLMTSLTGLLIWWMGYFIVSGEKEKS